MPIEEKKDLLRNSMPDGSFGKMYYDELRKSGVNHKEAIMIWIDGLEYMQSTSLSTEQLELFKRLLRSGKVQCV